MWYKLDDAPPPAVLRFAPYGALWRLRHHGKEEEAMRSEVVRVRMKPEERQALAALCGETRTASDVIRLLFRDQAGLPLPVGPIEADHLRGMNEELRRVGINLNQAVRAMNEGRVGYEPHLDAALRKLLDAVFRLRADVDLMLRISRQERRGRGHGL